MVALVGSQSPYVLEDDADAGFRKALANNQINLAMHYLVVRLEELDAEIAELKEAAKPKPAAKKTAAKKTAAKKTAVKVEEEEVAEEDVVDEE